MVLIIENIIYVLLFPVVSQIILPLVLLFIYCCGYSSIVLFEMGSGHEVRKWWRGKI